KEGCRHVEVGGNGGMKLGRAGAFLFAQAQRKTCDADSVSDFAASLGATVEDSWLLATLGLAIDAGAVIGLSVTALLWQAGHFLPAFAAFVLWVGFSMMSAIATAAALAAPVTPSAPPAIPDLSA